MKKIAWILILCLAAVCILSACSDGRQPVKPKKAYKDTLADIQEVISDPESEEDIIDGIYGIQEAILALGDAAADTVGYTYHDMNGDGQMELLIGNFEDTGALDVKNELYGAFTYKGGSPEPLFEKQKRNTYALTDTGTLYFYGSDGEVYHILAEYQMTEAGIVCIDFYFSYPKYGDVNNIEYFHNTTGEWDPNVSEKVDMTYEQFEELRKSLAARTVSIDAEMLYKTGKK
jgi:hypothetical protein